MLFFTHFFAFFLFPISWIIYDDNKFLRRCCFHGPVCERHKYSQRFKENDFEVVQKDGLVFLREMAAEVKNFMDFKMSAVMVSHLFKADL